MFETVSGEAFAPVADFQLSADTVETQRDIAFARLGDGGFVAVWLDSRYATATLRMQRFDLNGGKVGGEVILPEGGSPSLASTPGGGFLLTWSAPSPYPDVVDIKARFYDAALNPLGAEFLVNTTTIGFQNEPNVSPLAQGGYVVSWNHQEDPTYDYVRGQLLDADGNKVGGEIVITETAPGDKYGMGLAALAGGGFVAAWNGFEVADQFGNLSPGLRAQVFDKDGNKVGSAFSLNGIVPGTQSNATLAALPGGGFAAAWVDDGNPYGPGGLNGNQGIWVQLFDASGQKVGEAHHIGTGLAVAMTPTIAVTASGFVVAWPERPSFYSDRTELRAQRFDFAGNTVAEEFMAGAAAPAFQLNLSSLVLESGAILLGWESRAISGSSYEDARAQLLFPVTHGTEGGDSFAGTASRDFYIGKGGDDQAAGAAGSDWLTGDDGNDTLSGGADSDILEGGNGNDMLDGGAGPDKMVGGAGDDIYVVTDANDLVVEAEGGGTDTVRTSRFVYVLADNVENLEGIGATQTLTGNALANTIQGTATDDKLSGLGGNDVLRGGTGNDLLNGGEGDDRMEGGEGNDWVVAGLGVDTADGGAGEDGLQGDFSSSTVGVRIDVRQSVSSGAFGSYSNFEIFGAIIGSSFDDFFAGPSVGLEAIRLGAGDDVAVVWGISEVHGGSGSDTLVLDWATGNSTVFTTGQPSPSPGGGFSGAYNSTFNNIVQYTSIETFEIHTGVAGSYIYTASGNDRLYGGPSGDSFWAGAGNDLLEGGGGDDRLDGGLGADTMAGGAGDDIYIVDDAADEVTEGAGAGTDEVRTTLANYFLRAHFENLTGTAASGQSLVGNGLANVITGGAGNDSLIGSDAADFNSGNSGGIDTLKGGLGDDLYWVEGSDAVVENAGEGVDEVRTHGNYTLGDNLENLRALSDLGQVLQGNALGNILYGRGGADTLRGMDGDDMLVGSGLADVLEGGAGNDIYVVEGADTVTELAGQGTDEVRTAMGSRTDYAQMYTLPANVENFTGTSNSGQGVHLNALDNVVTLGAGGDLADLSHGGSDAVSGGGGDDFLYWGSAFTNADKADGGAGYDTVGLLGSYALAFDSDDLVSVEKLAAYSSGNPAAPNGYSFTMHDANVAAGQQLMVVAQSLMANEALTFSGSAELDGSFNVRGGRGADTITGGAKDDTIWGNLGADTLRGGLGSDVFEYNAAAESRFGAADTIMDFAKGDRINLSGIDADGNAANGDSKFSWLGEGAFSGQAGQLRVSQHPQYSRVWVVEADVDGDKVADLVVYAVTQPGFAWEKSDFYI